MSIEATATRLRADYGHLEGIDLLETLLDEPEFAGRTALVSSFGAESVVLLHMIARLDRGLPVIFLDTGKLFSETLVYRDKIVARLGLRDVRAARPSPVDLERRDPEGDLNTNEPDACCHIRKTLPLEKALGGFSAWITGRKRFQGSTRERLSTIEAEPGRGRIKLNPLAFWAPEQLEAYRIEHGLPPHPLVARGFRSIGCAPCTRAVRPDEDARAGRWAGNDKTECGIHLPGVA